MYNDVTMSIFHVFCYFSWFLMIFDDFGWWLKGLKRCRKGVRGPNLVWVGDPYRVSGGCQRVIKVTFRVKITFFHVFVIFQYFDHNYVMSQVDNALLWTNIIILDFRVRMSMKTMSFYRSRPVFGRGSKEAQRPFSGFWGWRGSQKWHFGEMSCLWNVIIL
jgi:hypothetical protein